jgi:hypothetical protein
MRLTVKIHTDNAAFDGALEAETARILRDAAERIEQGDLPARAGEVVALRDINGNRVGSAQWTREEIEQ